MNAEEINVAIAKIVNPEVPAWHDDVVGKFIFLSDDVSDSDVIPTLPNYYASLDACAQFEATLTPKQRLTYANTLTKLSGNWLNAISAAAPLRCLAFLTGKGITPPASGLTE